MVVRTPRESTSLTTYTNQGQNAKWGKVINSPNLLPVTYLLQQDCPSKGYYISEAAQPAGSSEFSHT